MGIRLSARKKNVKGHQNHVHPHPNGTGGLRTMDRNLHQRNRKNLVGGNSRWQLPRTPCTLSQKSAHGTASLAETISEDQRRCSPARPIRQTRPATRPGRSEPLHAVKRSKPLA
eukprot:13475319-Heterocapsa_arctica.AAC.1